LSGGTLTFAEHPACHLRLTAFAATAHVRFRADIRVGVVETQRSARTTGRIFAGLKTPSMTSCANHYASVSSMFQSPPNTFARFQT